MGRRHTAYDASVELRERGMRGLASRATSALCAVALITVTGCDRSFGPCVHQYREAVFHIVAARDAHDTTPLTTVILKDIRLDGVEQDLSLLVLPGTSYGVNVQGDSLICHVPCGIGTREGNYIFTVSAMDYPPQQRGYEASYRVFRGGCPSFNDGGVRATLRLSR